jgi:Ca2+-binding RTX toxin-like protein
MWDTASRGVVIDIMTGVATGQGRDTFGAPNTWIIGSPFADHITGGPAGDHINGERGLDTIAGNRGNDVIVADASTPGGRGTHDEVRGGRGNDRISSSSGSDAIWGGDGNDFIDDFGGAPDTVYAGAGADTIVYDLAEPDAQHPLTLGGGTGHDRLSLFSNHLNPTPATTSASGTWNMATGHLVFTVSGDAIVAGAAGFEEGHLSTFGATWTVRGTTGDDLMSAGSVKATTFTALAGDDTFLGSAYDDTFDGGPGTDRSLGMGAGDDTCISVEAFDVADCEHVLP